MHTCILPTVGALAKNNDDGCNVMYMLAMYTGIDLVEMNQVKIFLFTLY